MVITVTETPNRYDLPRSFGTQMELTPTGCQPTSSSTPNVTTRTGEPPKEDEGKGVVIGVCPEPKGLSGRDVTIDGRTEAVGTTPSRSPSCVDRSRLDLGRPLVLVGVRHRPPQTQTLRSHAGSGRSPHGPHSDHECSCGGGGSKNETGFHAQKNI